MLTRSKDPNEIIGEWEIESTTTQYYYGTLLQGNEELVQPGNGAYWEFTSSKVTMYTGSGTVKNGPTKYVYNAGSGVLTIGSTNAYKVVSLTDRKMTLTNEVLQGEYSATIIQKFVRR